MDKSVWRSWRRPRFDAPQHLSPFWGIQPQKAQGTPKLADKGLSGYSWVKVSIPAGQLYCPILKKIYAVPRVLHISPRSSMGTPALEMDYRAPFLNLKSPWCLVSFSAVQMDPITSSLTVLQVIQSVAQASALLYRYVASVRNVDSSCQSLLNELSAVGGVLTTVMVIEKDGSLPPNLSHALSKLMATDGPVANYWWN
ncbi:hypothetical protein BDR03DRAFT_1007826 [Suillus americanus]|nr:hypothetical protein BDR03DRAFT_1007826 [Suillus americanus]